MTIMSCARAPGVIITSPSAKGQSSNLLIILVCCSSVKRLKKLRSLEFCTSSTNRALIALFRSTSSTGPINLSSELFPKARHMTLSMAFAPHTCCLVYIKPALPKIVPGFFTTKLPCLSTVCTLPSMTMNIQSPTSPSRRIWESFPKTCTVQAPASRLRSSGFIREKVGSRSRKFNAVVRCFELSFSIQDRKVAPSICQSTPSSLQVTVAVLFTL
mmetsp:Transcript_19820/g.32138  ORF Transcript_19820/g.32138 Transcript_19820/m.32138 type:complete len:215 (-) Transcript_19820:675-1319(-)